MQKLAVKRGWLKNEPFDHIVRFKSSCNPGRLYPFVCAGLPVIGDFCPSASQFISDSESGLLASSVHGWIDAFVRLYESPSLRTKYAHALYNRIKKRKDRQVYELMQILSEPQISRPFSFADLSIIRNKQSLSDSYAKPPGSIKSKIRSLIGKVRYLQ